METTEKDILRGGQFLVKETQCNDIFTPEDFTEEQKKQRLLNAGAHLIVHKPYQNVPELLDAIFKGYQE